MLHAAVVREHWEEWALFGAFFVAAALAQGVWGSLLLNGVAPRWLVGGGGFGQLAIIAVWVLSRTVGLPVGPDVGIAERIGFLDALTTAFEGLAVLGAAAMLRGAGPRVRVPVWLVGAAVAGLTAAAVLTAPDHV